MISLHKLHCHIHYEEFYQYKKFQKFSINTLITIACSNVKNKQNVGLGQLEVNNLIFEISYSFLSQSLIKR